MNNGECISKNNNEPNESDIKNNWQNIAEKARFYNQLDQKASNLDYENKFNSETNIEPAKIVAVENKDNIYHIEGILNSENIEMIVKEFKERADVEYFARLVDNSEIIENDYNLSVSTYVEKEDTREKIDIKVLNKEISETVRKIDELRASIDEIVRELESDE